MINMSNFHDYSLNEGAKSGNEMGYLIFFSGSWWMGAFPSFPAFAARFYEDYSGMDINDLDGPIIDDAMLRHIIGEGMGDRYGHSEMIEHEMSDFRIWCGLNTKLSLGTLTSHYNDGNPYKAIESLEKCFVGIKSLMQKNPDGNTGKPDYIARSIENDSSYGFDQYIAYFAKEHDNFEPDFTLDEVIQAIKEPDNLAGYFKSNPLDLDLLDCNQKLKADVVKLAEIKDVSKLARNLRRGSI